MNVTASKTKYEYMNKKSIEQYCICAICKEPLIDPVSTNCTPKSHIYCRDCIEKWLKLEPFCPSCSHELHSQDLTPASGVDFIDILNNLLVKCLGCKQTGLKRIEFDAHYNKICPIDCPSSDIACSWTGSRDELNEHLKICTINLIKPIITGFQGIKQLIDWIGQLENENAILRKENEKLKQSVEPVGTDHSLYDKEDLKEIMENKLQELTNKLNQNRIENEIRIKNYKSKQIDFKKLEKYQQQPKLGNLTDKLPDPQKYSHIHQEQKHIHDGYTDAGNFDRTNYFPAHPGFNAAHNPLPRNYHSLDNGYPTEHKSSGNFPSNDGKESSPNDGTQNLYNGPIIWPCIIPITTPISIHTNIAGGNHNNATGSATNIAGGSSNNNPGPSNNNNDGGISNNIAGGNTNASGTNNNITGGSHNYIVISNSNVGHHRAAGFNNILNNNHYGGRLNNIAGGNTNAAGSNKDIAAGNHNFIRNNVYDRNLLNNPANGENFEENADDSGLSVTDERRTGDSVIGDRIGQYPYIVSPPTGDNHRNY